jgi:hypothetical protein
LLPAHRAQTFIRADRPIAGATEPTQDPELGKVNLFGVYDPATNLR